MYEIYSTGGGEFLEMTFNGIAAFFNTSNANALVAIGVMVGLFAVVFQVMFSASLVQTIQAYVVIALVGTLSIGDKSEVIIFDPTKDVLWFRTVDNVPTSIAYLGSATSSVSQALTRQIEAVFSTPTNLAYQRHGMLFGATLMSKSARWRAVSSVVHENLTNFVDQCVIDAVDLRYIQPDAITRSGNLEASIAANMPASLAYYDVQTRTTRECADGWPDIVSSMNAEVDVVLAAQAASTFQGADASVAIADMENVINDFTSVAGYAAASAENHVKQAMLIAAFDDAANRGISATGNAAALDHLQSARAELQTRSSYQAVGANALSWVPYLKIVFENLYYGAFPIALMLMMIPAMTFQVMKGYFGGFVWLASWEPLSAILHSIMTNATVERFQTITSASTSGAYTDSVMSWANHFGVYSIGQDVSVMAGYLMMSVPFVASALFFGTSRMVGLSTSMLAVSQSAASETGREMATGNISYANSSVGNASYRNFSADNYARNNRTFDNTSANRTVTSPYSDTGRSSYFGGDGSLITRNADGSIGIDGASSRVNTATGVSLGNSVVTSLRTTANEFMERGMSARQTYERSHSDLTSRTSSFMQSVQSGEAFSQGRGLNISAEDRSSLSNSVQVMDQFAERFNVSRQTALEVGAHASAGISWGALSAEAKTSLRRSGVSEDTFQNMSTAARTDSIDNAVSDLTRASREYSSSSTGSSTVSGDKGSRYTLDDIGRQARSAETFERGASTYSEAADQTRSNMVDNRLDLSGRYATWLTDQGFSSDQVAGILNGRSNNPSRDNALRAQFTEAYINDLVPPSIGANFSNPLPGPIDPGRPVENLGDVHDGAASIRPRFSENKLETDIAILRGSNQMGGVGAGGADIEARHREMGAGHSAAATESWSNKPHQFDRLGGGAGSVPASGYPDGYVDQRGFYQAENISYELIGAIRNQPVNAGLMDNISRNASLLGDNIGVVVTSGGQPSHGDNRTGSHRHDDGRSVDFYLTRDGQRVNPADDRQLYADMIELSARSNTGIGHYDWGLHVGGGSEAFWGPTTRSASADPYFKSAYDRGRGQ